MQNLRAKLLTELIEKLNIIPELDESMESEEMPMEEEIPESDKEPQDASIEILKVAKDKSPLDEIELLKKKKPTLRME